MLKPKYVHGINADQAPQSLLHRLQNEGGQKVWPFDDLPPGGGDGMDDDPGIQWTWKIG